MGRVSKHSLELHADARGWVVDPVIGRASGGRLGHVHLASLAPGAVRGNHAHPDRAESFAIWGGPAEVAWEDETGKVVRERIDGREPVVFEVPQGVAHAVRNVGNGEIYLLAYYFGDPAEGWPRSERRSLG